MYDKIKPSNIFSEFNDEDCLTLNCVVCNKNLLENPHNSMIKNISYNFEKIIRVEPCCKGDCYRVLESQLLNKEYTQWNELTDYLNPYVYFAYISQFIWDVKDNKFSNDDVIRDYELMFQKFYPYITRNYISKDEIKNTESSIRTGKAFVD